MAAVDTTPAERAPETWPATISQALLATMTARPDEPALKWREGGSWSSWTWSEYADHIARAATGLRDLGIERGDRIILMTRNRPEFHVLDLAAVLIGAVPVSVYNSSSPEQLRYVAAHAEATTAVVEDVEYLERFLAVRQDLVNLRRLVVISDPAGAAPPEVTHLERLFEAPPADLEAASLKVKPDDIATLIYTSGTTGPSKAVEITQSNVAWTVRSLLQAVGHHLPGWRMISFLPMAHVAERVATHYLHLFEGTEVTTCRDARLILEYLREVRPQVLFAVPLIWERAHASLRSLAAANPEQEAAFLAALEVGREVDEARRTGRDLEPDLELRRAEQEPVLSFVRELVGLDQVQLAVSSAAPIGPEVVQFFRSLGVPLSELYGMSESTGPITWDPYEARPGDVGRPIPGCQVRLAPDGEVLALGGNVFAGYLKDPDATARAIDSEGWLHTGDLGELREGRLRIVGRKKDLIVTAGGENISPSNIETALRGAPLVEQACVAGDRRPYLVALLTLDREALRAWAARRDLQELDADELLGLPELLAEVRHQVDEVNEDFGRAERIRAFKILDHDWPVDSDVLTPTMKVKREQVLAKYAAEIDALYDIVR